MEVITLHVLALQMRGGEGRKRKVKLINNVKFKKITAYITCTIVSPPAPPAPSSLYMWFPDPFLRGLVSFAALWAPSAHCYLISPSRPRRKVHNLPCPPRPAPQQPSEIVLSYVGASILCGKHMLPLTLNCRLKMYFTKLCSG